VNLIYNAPRLADRNSFFVGDTFFRVLYTNDARFSTATGYGKRGRLASAEIGRQFAALTPASADRTHFYRPDVHYNTVEIERLPQVVSCWPAG
jgi:hypothetical protein